MRNIDSTLIDLIDEKIKKYAGDIQREIPQEQLEIIIDKLIKGTVERHLINRVQEIISKNSSHFIMDALNELFEDDKFISNLKDAMKRRINYEDF